MVSAVTISGSASGAENNRNSALGNGGNPYSALRTEIPATSWLSGIGAMAIPDNTAERRAFVLVHSIDVR